MKKSMKNIGITGGKVRLLVIAAILLVSVTARTQPYTLRQCINTALLHNRNIKLAQHDLSMAAEKSKEIRGHLIPKLNAMADYRYYVEQPYQLMPAEAFAGPEGSYKEVQFGTPQSLNANLALSVPLVNPTVFNSIHTAGLAVELSEIQKSKTDEEVVKEVAGTYFNAQVLLNQLIFLDSNISNSKKLVRTITLLHDQRMAKGTDVDRLKLQLEQTVTRRSTVSSQYQQALNALKFQMGKPISDTIAVSVDDQAITRADLPPQITNEMKMIDKKLEMNYAEIKGMKSSRLPSLNAYGFYGTSGFGDTGPDGFFNFYPIGYVGAQLSVPIFNGTVTRHQIDQKKIEREKTIIQKDLIREKTTLDRINAEIQYSLAKQNILLMKDQIELAGAIYENTLLENQQGLAGVTEVLLADNALQEAQQNYIVSLIDLRRAELEYLHVTGNIMTIKN